MGTRCPLHLISSLSHGVLSPGRQSRAGIKWKREALADLGLRFSPRKYVVHRNVTWAEQLGALHGAAFSGSRFLRLINSPCAFEHVKLKSPIKSNSEVDKYWQLRSGNGAITRGESYPGAGHPQHRHRCWLLMSLAVLVVLRQFDLWIHQDDRGCFSAFARSKLTLIPGKKNVLPFGTGMWISVVTLAFNWVIFRDSMSRAFFFSSASDSWSNTGLISLRGSLRR